MTLGPQLLQISNTGNGASHLAAIDGDKLPTRLSGEDGGAPALVDGAGGGLSAAAQAERQLGSESDLSKAERSGSLASAHEVVTEPSPAVTSGEKSARPSGEIVSQEWTRESLIKAIKDGQTEFYDANLRGLDLTNIAFDKALLVRADFTGSTLRGVDFSKSSSLYSAKFSKADLDGVNFAGHVLMNLDFEGARLTNVSFDGSELLNSNFRDTSMRNMDFRATKRIRDVNFKNADFDGVNFSGQNLPYAAFGGAVFKNVNFDGTNLWRADFTRCGLQKVDFRRVESLRAAGFEQADLAGANFTGLDLGQGQFMEARNIKSAKFKDADLHEADLSGAEFAGMDFSNLKTLKNAKFYSANLEGANFRGLDVKGVNFGRSNLKNARFEGANLADADFSDSVLTGVDFSKAKSLIGAVFRRTELAGASFSGKAVPGDFSGAKNVRAANFHGADIRVATFIDSDLTLTDYFSPHSAVMRTLTELGVKANILTDLAEFICTDPDNHKSILERELLRGMPFKGFSSARFWSFAQLESHYGEDSPVMKALTELESDGRFFINVRSYVNEDPENNYTLVAKEALKEGGPERLDRTRLEALKKLQQYFENSPAELQQVLNMERSGAVTLDLIRDFIQENPESHKLVVQHELKQSAEHGVFEGQFAYSRLRALSSLGDWFGRDSEMMRNILRLEKEGLPLNEMGELLNKDPVQQAHVQTLISQGAPADTVLRAIRDQSSNLLQYFSAEQADYLSELTDRRLRTGQLRAFIADNPVERLALVEDLIRSKATVQRFHDQMSLSMLPDDVSRTILDGGEVPVPEIIGPMRNWQSGRYFRELLIEQVRAGEPVSRTEIEKLAVLARELASQRNVAGQGDASVLEQSGDGGKRGSRDGASFQVTNPRAIEAAKIINEALEEILKEIPQDKTIVVLGRDALPLYPALKNRGRNAQYFLWSRLQINDQTTEKQWRQEVGPEAVVIDTGYGGSILDAVNSIDPTVSAYLLSSSGVYPQLLKRHDHSSVVDNLEYFPKLVARSSKYTEKGGAVSRKGDTDEHDDVKTDRWTVESLNRQFLRAIGLDEWGVWRYSRFAGLTPEERLGVDTREEVERHYAQVKASRNAAASDAIH